MSSCGWVRRRSGSVDLRSERPGITGHGAVDVVEPMAPPGRASGLGGTQECTQIS